MEREKWEKTKKKKTGEYSEPYEQIISISVKSIYTKKNHGQNAKRKAKQARMPHRNNIAIITVKKALKTKQTKKRLVFDGLPPALREKYL